MGLWQLNPGKGDLEGLGGPETSGLGDLGVHKGPAPSKTLQSYKHYKPLKRYMNPVKLTFRSSTRHTAQRALSPKPGNPQPSMLNALNFALNG